ncbi:MAG: TonB-dependent receptor [Candidatus Manganitrophaceae bacterium]|nr:MAG: TonB-dependent receptor [Candidatus Manganitrophaceae bacterium]
MTPFQWRVAFCSLLVLVTVSTRVFGAEEPSEEIPTFPPVFVTATRTEVPLQETAASVTIIDRKTIEEKHLITVADALREVPGLDVVAQGGLGATTSVFTRGTDSAHTLVLIDGVPVNDPNSGAFDFSNLTVDNIERIEVIRGPQSTLYGSDAIGGVIQIFTKKGQGPPTTTLSLEAGAYYTFRENAGVSGSTERLDYSLSVGRIDSRGFSRADRRAGNPEDDGEENTTFSTRLGFDVTEKIRIEWTGRYTNSESDLDGCDPVTFFCPVDNLNFVQKDKQWVTALNLTTIFLEGWKQHLTLGYHTDQMNLSDPDPIDVFNNSKFDASRKWLDWRHDLTLGRRDLLTVGYEHESQRGESEGSFDEGTVNNAFYAFNQFRPLPFIFNLGVRYDDNNRFGNETTYKVETAYLIEATRSKVRAAYGTGFHGPTIVDLFFPCCGNPNLEPEKSKSFEAGFDQLLWSERLRMAATYFQNRIEQLIVFDFSQSIPLNVARAKINGWEFELSGKPTERVSLSANYTLMNTLDENTGEELVRRPRHKATGSVSVRPIDPLRLVLQVIYVGKRFDFGSPSPLGDYAIAHLAGTYTVNKSLALFGRLENLFDRKYQEVTGYGTAGFSGYGGVKVTF